MRVSLRLVSILATGMGNSGQRGADGERLVPSTMYEGLLLSTMAAFSSLDEDNAVLIFCRLLSNRPYCFEALCSSIKSMLLSVKGVDVQQLQEGRFLLRFNHIIDKQRALKGCPWSFEKNILILGEIGESKNPMHVALDFCDFHVHIHDLSLNMMNLGVATLIGNRLDVFRDMEADDAGCSWSATVRVPSFHGDRSVSAEINRGGKGILGEISTSVLRAAANPAQPVMDGEGIHLDVVMSQDNVLKVSGCQGEKEGALETSGGLPQLINVPLQFTFGEPLMPRGCHQRGRPPCRTHRGRSRKRCRGIQLIELDGTAVHTAKKRVQVGVDSSGSDSMSAETASQPGLVFISEIKCKARRCERIKETVNYFGLGVDFVGKGGALILLWCNDIDVWLQSFSNHHVDITVKSDEYPERWRFTGFYGYSEVTKRKEGWNLVRRLSQVSVQPWLCVGDFNEALDQQEKQGTLLQAQWRIRYFRSCLQDCGLQDLGFQGNLFTWCNHQ
ncbi:UNVERIFIED_CONTAM: hypothetical protein Slati_2112900 [Sesamum latifolium]|uniref:DUF4283 domain-containing protein n=1 Tax=Sesamum latifolium TaxID=2727402 RepID=A0AAW2WQC4_9LAMI